MKKNLIRFLIKVLIMTIVLVGILYWIMQNPVSIYDVDTQNRLVDTADQLDELLSWHLN